MEGFIDFDNLDFDQVLDHEMAEDPILAMLAHFDASTSGTSSMVVETPHVGSTEASQLSLPSSSGQSGQSGQSGALADLVVEEAPMVTKVSGIFLTT